MGKTYMTLWSLINELEDQVLRGFIEPGDAAKRISMLFTVFCAKEELYRKWVKRQLKESLEVMILEREQ